MNSIKVDCKDLVRKKICILIVVQSLSRVQLGVTLWTVALQPPLSVGFPRQEYWSGLPFPPPEDPQTQGSNPCLLCLLHWQAGSSALCAT